MHATSVTMHMDVGFLGICAHVKDIGVSNYTKRLDPFKKYRVRVKLILLILFLPLKKYNASANRTWNVWDLLCLKESGWGHQAEQTK